MPASSLSARQRLFATEYLKDRNGTQAAIRAGYSKNGAHVAAIRLLRKDTIRALFAVALGTEDITREELVGRLAGIVRSKPNPESLTYRDVVSASIGIAKIKGFIDTANPVSTAFQINIRVGNEGGD